MSLGPLQVMIVNFEDPNFTGGIEAELVRLQNAGILRVLDLIVVAKSLDGEIEIVKTGEVHTGSLTQALLSANDGEDSVTDDPDVWYAADAIEPGQAAAIAVLDHQWAIGLREAITEAGGHHVVTEWVDEAQVAELGVALPD